MHAVVVRSRRGSRLAAAARSYKLALHDAARRRRARGVEEHPAKVLVHAPAEVLVEGQGTVEHVAHISDALDRPITEVLVEGIGVFEHL